MKEFTVTPITQQVMDINSRLVVSSLEVLHYVQDLDLRSVTLVEGGFELELASLVHAVETAMDETMVAVALLEDDEMAPGEGPVTEDTPGGV